MAERALTNNECNYLRAIRTFKVTTEVLRKFSVTVKKVGLRDLQKWWQKEIEQRGEKLKQNKEGLDDFKGRIDELKQQTDEFEGRTEELDKLKQLAGELKKRTDALTSDTMKWPYTTMGKKKGDPNTWDISVLCCAISQYRGWKLSAEQQKRVNLLKEVRDQIAHNRRCEITDGEFEAKYGKLISSYKELLGDATADPYIQQLERIKKWEIQGEEAEALMRDLQSLEKKFEECEEMKTCLLAELSCETEDHMQQVGKEVQKGLDDLEAIQKKPNDDHLQIEEEVFDDLFPAEVWRWWKDFGKHFQLNDDEIGKIQEQEKKDLPDEGEFRAVVKILMHDTDMFIFSKENIYEALKKCDPEYAEQFKAAHYKRAPEAEEEKEKRKMMTEQLHKIFDIMYFKLHGKISKSILSGVLERAGFQGDAQVWLSEPEQAGENISYDTLDEALRGRLKFLVESNSFSEKLEAAATPPPPSDGQ